MGNVKAILVNSGDAIKNLGQLAFYILHPGMIFQSLWNYTVIYSYWICLIIFLLSMIFYALGFKKCAKYMPGSLAIYALIKMIAVAI